MPAVIYDFHEDFAPPGYPGLLYARGQKARVLDEAVQALIEAKVTRATNLTAIADSEAAILAQALAAAQAYTGAAGKVTAETTRRNLRLHDGASAGGKIIYPDQKVLHTSNFGAKHDLVVDTDETVDSASDDTAAMNDAFDALRDAASHNQQRQGGCTLIVDGPTYCEGSLDWTDLQQNGVTVAMTPGSQIYSAAAGKPAVDLTGTRWLHTSGLRIFGDPSNPPSTGLLQARLDTTAAASHMVHWAPHIDGAFTVACMSSLASEECTIFCPNFRNAYDDPDALVMLISASNDWGLTSDFQTIVTGDRSNNVMEILGAARFYKIGAGRTLHIRSAHGVHIPSLYSYAQNPDDAVDSHILIDHSAQVSGSNVKSNSRIYIGQHLENADDGGSPPASTMPHMVLVKGDTGVNTDFRFAFDWNPAITDAPLAFEDSNGIDGLDLTVSLAGRDGWKVKSGTGTKLTSLRARDLNKASGGTGVFDTASLAAANGRMDVYSAAQITGNPADITGAETGIHLLVTTQVNGAFIYSTQRVVSLAAASTELTTMNAMCVRVNVAGASTATLATIPAGVDNQDLFLCSNNTVTISAAGNIRTKNPLPVLPTNGEGYMHLKYDEAAAVWVEVGSGIKSPPFSATEFDDSGSELNTHNKSVGDIHFDTTTGQPLFAAEASAGGDWKDFTGAVVYPTT